MYFIKKKKKEAGFTLLELMVVIALMAIIFSITLSNYNGMNKKIELENLVYDVALSIREAQLYGINKKLAKNEFSDGETSPFGFHIDISNSDTKNKLWIFSDIDKNFYFDDDCSTTQEECQTVEVFPKGMHIKKIILYKPDGTKIEENKINIMFRRPNPDAKIIIDSGPDNTGQTLHSKVCIEITSKTEIYTGAVVVGAAGDIYVQQNCN